MHTKWRQLNLGAYKKFGLYPQDFLGWLSSDTWTVRTHDIAQSYYG